eukprot:TRINITY_DN33419_c0_g1_i1.p1 TRINITY_DN33419_c0_g1~~TRINITY_DN33419_c0_g1_i1.p1  ORF type:complete len:502 (+),score=109.78 TRINITY_DN33419_c0_g1_i1:198-1508(+)
MKYSPSYNQDWLLSVFAKANDEIHACWVNAGRYWQVELRLNDLLLDMPIPDANLLFSLFLSSWSKLTREGVPVVRVSICAPFACAEGSDVEALLPHYFRGRFLRIDPAMKSSQDGVEHPEVPERIPWLSGYADIQELGDWRELSLDFAIIGVEHCGSSSLHKNLLAHPGIVFSSDQEEGFFGYEIQHQILPKRSQVKAFNDRMQAAVLRKQKEGLAGPFLRGATNPSWYSMGLTRMALFLTERVKAIVILCEPMGRLERFFMEYEFCHEDMEAAARQNLSRYRPEGHICEPSAQALIRRPDVLEKYATVRHHMKPLLSHFGDDRLFVLHQEYLKLSHMVFFAAADFLGAAGDFPADFKPRRYNSRGAIGTDLCSNATLVRALRRLLEPEYHAQEELLRASFNPVPPSLTERRTRCDRLFALRQAESAACIDRLCSD